MFQNFNQLPSPSLPDKIFYFATGLGHQSVVVFFVLSGFFVGGSVLRGGTNFSWKKYAVARLSRLWMVLLPALAVTATIDATIFYYSPSALAGIFHNDWSSGPDGAYSSSPSTLLGNLVFLQTIFVPVFGSNGPLWSLANEFWYYALFPLCFYCADLAYGATTPSSKSYSLKRCIPGIIACGIFYLMPMQMRWGFVIWLMGATIYALTEKQKRSSTLLSVLGAGALFALSLAFSKFRRDENDLIGVALGIGFSAWCYTLVHFRRDKVFAGFFAKAARGLSEMSYSLYLTHFPIVVLLGGTVFASHRYVPGVLSLLDFLLWLACTLIFAAGFWWLFEKRTAAVRKFADNFLRRPILPLAY